ncbi:SNF2-related protein [Streptomyces sp. NPDC006267]|uniref:SNF2-related protein n=1 Tax=Streptomyces sp. NPDC006267 TaxID=3157173 RepID=UPI0033B4F32E
MSFTATTGTPTTLEDHDVGSLDAGQWHEALKQLAGLDTDDTAMARDALRRSRVGLLSVRDMRLVLLATPDTPTWLPARQAVMDHLVHNPETARQVLATHTQVEVWPPPRFEEPDTAIGDDQVTVAAVIGTAESQVTGPAQSAATSREAKDRAALALLARLAGVILPGQDPAAPGEPQQRLVLPGMPSEVFEQRLRQDVEAGQGPGAELVIEALKRARAGRLRHRELYLFLFEARSRAWAAVREVAIQRAAAMPPAPAQLLHWHAAQHGADHGLTYTEDVDDQGLHHTRALLTVGAGTTTGPVRSASVRKTARHYAACALLALMADLPEPPHAAEGKPAPTPRITVPGPGEDPVKYLNKHHQLDTITKPETSVRTLGTRKEVTYSCRYRASDTPVRATATGPDKTSARRAAALKLLRKLHALDRAAPTPAPDVAGPAERRTVRPETASTPPSSAPAPAPRTPAAPQRAVLDVGNRPAAALLLDAVTCGCAVTFMPRAAGQAAAWRVQDTGRLALPMTGLPDPLTAEARSDGPTGWSVPLLEGLPVLRHAHRGASTTAKFWQRALHIALQLIAAQLVHPAHDGGRAAWRVGPIPPNAEHALSVLADAVPTGATPPAMPARQALGAAADAIADALIRTPAAELFGTGPWTHPDRTTADAEGEVGVWLDSVADQIDGGPAPQVIVRIEDPSDEQATTGRLTAELHLAPAATDTSPDEAPVPAAHLWSGAAHLAGQHPDAVRPRVRRLLRRAARRCPALAGLAAQEHPGRCTLYPAAIEALLEQEAELAEHGMRVEWPEQLRTALQAAAVIGTDPAPGAAGHRPAGEAPRFRFSVTALLDFRWQVALDGIPLSEQEMDALAEAARHLVRVRGRWVLADPILRRRARHRLLGHLPGTQALTAALTGTITIEDTLVPCRTTGQLAHMIGTLTGGEHHPEPVPVPTGLRATLRGYQERALTWLAHTTSLGFGAVLADDMGLGKTLTAISFILHLQQHTPGPALVICPASLVTTWCREAARFAPGLDVLAYHGPDRTLDEVSDTTVVVTTYGVLRRDTARLACRTWPLVIADEAQHAKNPASSTARQLRALPSTTRLALTGTPVENNLSELWALLDWTNPGIFGTLKAYRARWANAAEKNPGGEQARELGRIIAPFLLRRRKTDPGIPPSSPPRSTSRAWCASPPSRPASTKHSSAKPSSRSRHPAASPATASSSSCSPP